ncbi:MAG: MFS transporter [Lentisphaeria bacterium]
MNKSVTEAGQVPVGRRLGPEETGREIRRIYTACLLYAIGETLFTNSFMLLYLAKLGVPSERILLYLAIPVFASIFALVPFARWIDRFGKIFTGVAGLALGTLGMVVLIVAGFLPVPMVEPLVILAMGLYGIGFGMYLDGWFTMLATIVPEASRGRFFGNNRFIYQAGTIAFTFWVTWVLGRDSSLLVFQGFFALVVLFRVLGIALFAKIPELGRRPAAAGVTLWASLSHAIGQPGYLAFCAYVFLLSLFTGACPAIISLLAKDTLRMTAGQVMLIGNLLTIGALAGFFLGGRLADRIGTRYVFMSCHFSFALILVAFLLRTLMPLPLLYVVGALALLFGLVQASSSVAISSEMLAIIPEENKAMATAVNLSLMYLGVSLSGIFSSRILKLGMLSPAWKLFGCDLGAYDSLLLACGVMMFLLVVTLGLVPSVIKKVQPGDFA